jgi:alkylhydroperoxidase/carboxymuconolactone decarboxylase family protein YurZ
MSREITPLTDLQKQFQDIVQPQLEQITIEQEPLETITLQKLQDVLLERDIDDILCWKGGYSSDMSIEAKVQKVLDILTEILTDDSQPSAMDALIKQLIEQSIVYDLKNQKRKQLTADFQRAFNGLVTKEDIKETRKQIKSSKSFEEAEKASEKAATKRSKAKKKSRDKDKIEVAVNTLQEFTKVLEDDKSDIKLVDFKELINKCSFLLEQADKLRQKELNNQSIKQAKEKEKQEQPAGASL